MRSLQYRFVVNAAPDIVGGHVDGDHLKQHQTDVYVESVAKW